MKRLAFAVLVLSSLAAAPAFAENVCNVPADQAQPTDALKAKLEAEGWTVRLIKNDRGCYEAYAMKADGTRMESLFDPATLELLNTPAN